MQLTWAGWRSLAETAATISADFPGRVHAFPCHVGRPDALAETWAAIEVQPWIEAITGFIQVDDYKGYSAEVESMLETGKSVQLVPDQRRLGCMMHVRRRFYEAFTLGDERAAPAVDWIRKIYEVEADGQETRTRRRPCIRWRTKPRRCPWSTSRTTLPGRGLPPRHPSLSRIRSERACSHRQQISLEGMS